LVLTPKALGADGVSALTALVGTSLANANIDTRILALEQDARGDLGDRVTVPIESANGGKLRFLLNGIKAAPRGRRPELVVATHLRMLPAALPLMASGVPVATFLLGVECWRPLSRRDRTLLSRCDRLLPISRFTWARFVEANPAFQHAPMTLCPLAAEPLPVSPEPPVRGRTLVVGRLWAEERYKGHDALIDAWTSVRRACPDAHLVIVGDGDDRPRLEARVAAAGLGDVITFTGLISQDELRRQFASAAVFALPSEGEGFGLVFLEAMRAARPCIAAHGAAEEIVVDGVTGRIVPARDAGALTSALVELLSDPARAAMFGRAGRARFENEFSSTPFRTRLIDALHQTAVTC
jgi:phosphatidylinositol alpha-1,6-mannosyltransferase